MADFGAPVAAGVNVNPLQGLKTISDLMSLQQQGQAIQSKGIGIQQQQQELQTQQGQAQAAQQAMATRQKLQAMTQSGVDDQGNNLYLPGTQEIDPGKFAVAAVRVDPVNGPGIAQGAIKTNSDRVALHSAMLGLTMNQRTAVMGPMQAAALSPTPENMKAANDSIDGLVAQNPEMAPVAASAKRLLAQAAQNPDPNARAKMANTFSATYQPGQAVQTQPTGTSVNAGGTVQVGAAAPPVAGGGFTPATTTTITPPPTTEVVDPITGAKHLIGQPGQPGPATTLPIGAEAGVASNVADMNTHFSGLQNASQGAALISGLTGNVKALAQKAVTGTEADRQAYVNGLLNTLGVGDKISGNLQTDTDLLHKQLAQINTNTKASTDAAQTLINAAQPNSHMNAKAMGEAADQIASQVQLNMAIRNKLSSLKYANNGQGDTQGYQAMRQKIEAVADPRALQWQNLGPGSPEAKAYVQGLKPADQKALRKSVAGMRELGLM